MKILALLFALVMTTACNTYRNQVIDENILNKPSSVLIARAQGGDIVKYEEGLPQHYGSGAGLASLLDIVASAVRSSGHQAAAAVNDINLAPIYRENYLQAYARKFSEYKWNLRLLDDALSERDLVWLNTQQDKTKASFDGQILREEYDADYALILFTGKLCVYREKGLVGKVTLCANQSIMFVDLKTNEIKGIYAMNNMGGITGEWNEPPHFSNLRQSMKNAVQFNLDNSVDFFFNPASKLRENAIGTEPKK